MKVCNLASGSKGNCTCVTTGSTSVIIDQGLNLRELARRSQERDFSLRRLSAIIITHEHSDHIKGVSKLAETYSIPVYIHKASRATLNWQSDLLVDVDMDMPFEIGDLSIDPFRLPHDSVYNLGYRITNGVKTMSIATDLGVVTDNVINKLGNCDFVMLESNHDMQMLLKGRYPYYLKQRILSTQGHLSNEECAKAVTSMAKQGLRKVMLAHLSQDNNTPELAFEKTKQYLKDNNIKEGKDIALEIASQSKPSEWIQI